MPALLEMALDLAQRGIPVFPCAANKAPVIPKGQPGGEGHRDATTDPETIRERFDRRGAALIGVPTGEASGLDVLDIDPRHNGNLWEGENADRLPETRIHSTLNGGRHWVFIHAPGVRNSAHKIAEGVDVRGEGGYVCFPPSAGYEIISEAEPVHWPDWLLEKVIAASAARERLARPAPATDGVGNGNGNGNGHNDNRNGHNDNGNGHNGHTDRLSQRRVDGYIAKVVAGLARAREGEKHFMLRNAAMAIGGVMAQAGLSEKAALDRLIGALPSTVKDWKTAQDTALWGLRTGRLAEIELPDRPLDRPARPSRSRGNGHDRGNGNGHDRGYHEPDTGDAPAPLDGEVWEDWRPLEQIPPRPWLLGNLLMRGATTLIGAPGAAGKSALAMAIALAVITGRADIIGEEVLYQGAVWYLSLEDDRLEFMRRLRAAMKEHEIAPAEITGKLIVKIGRERKVVVAQTGEDGQFELCQDAGDIEAGLKRHGCVLAILDPIVKSHRLVENNNGHMDQLADAFNEIASRTNCALLLLHHFHKRGVTDGSGRDAIRGGGALVDSFRLNRTMSSMTAKDAETFGIPDTDARFYVRLDDVKANLSPRSDAMWFELRSVALNNPSGPHKGDHLQAIARWLPGDPTAGLNREQVAATFDAWRQGYPDDGNPYTPGSRGSNKRWAGRVLMEIAGCSLEQAKRLMEIWRKNGVWSAGSFKNKNNQLQPGLVLDEFKAADLLKAYKPAPISAQ